MKIYTKKERKECMGEDVNLTEVRDQIDKLTKLVMSLSEHKTKVRVAGYVEKRKERKSELEQELLLRCATVMDKIKDRDDNFICTYSDVVNIYKLMGSEKIRFISMNSDKLNCSHCFIRNKSHLSVYLKRFIMWLMDNSSKYNLVLKGSSIYI